MSRNACHACGAPTQADLCAFCQGAKAMAPAGAELIAAERRRQVTVEGWTEDHDDRHEGGELAYAAICYLDPDDADRIELCWPWDMVDFKPSEGDRLRDLVKAGALVAAEIDRLLRAAG